MEILLYRRRQKELSITIYAPDDSVVPVNNDDVVRIKIGRAGAAPLLDLDSVAASANGSTVTKANPTSVTLAAADVTLLPPGTYEIEAAIYESDDGKIRGTRPGIVHIVDTMSGEVGAT